MTDAIVARVRGRVSEGGLLPEGTPVLVLLSGGRDSVCLLDSLVAVRGAAGVAALHVDHGLREDSTADARACAELCEHLGVPLDVERLGEAPASGNLQAWAREGRYAAASRRAAADGALVAVAHTRSDQVETILYRLAASPGRRALLGMEPRRDDVVRPLLGTSREETTAYCEARGLRWTDDPSNATDAYARGRVRHRLLPALREIHPAAEENVLRTAEILREEAAVLDAAVSDLLGDEDAVEVQRLAQAPPALARLVLRRLAEGVTGRPCPRAPGRLADVLALSPSGALDLGDGARATVAAGVLRVVPTPPLPERGGAFP